MSFLSQLTDEAKKKLAFIESLVSHPSAPVQQPQTVQNITPDQLNANINRNQGAINQLAQNPQISAPPVAGVSQPSFMQRVSNGLNNINQQTTLAQRTPAPSVLDNIGPSIQYGIKNPMDVLNQVPQATGQVLGGVSNTFAPSMTKFFTNAGDVIGEGAQLGMNTIVKSLNTPENTVNVPEFNAQNYPALFKDNPADMLKQTVGAGLEATVLKYIPETAKMGIIARGGVGALQGMGFSLANGISNNKSWDDIKKDMTSNGIAASVIMMAEPYLKPLLTGQGLGTQLSSDVSGVKDEFGNIKSDINQLRNPQGGNMPFSPQSDFFKTLQKGSNVPVGLSIKDVSGEDPLIQEGGAEIKRVGANILKNNPGITQKDAEAMAKDVIENRKPQSQGITPNVSLEKPQPTVAGQETGVPLENQPPGQTAPDTIDNKLPPQDVSYNQDVAPNGDNVKQRGFLDTLQNSDKATPEMKQGASELPQGYTPIPQKLSETNAQKFVDEVGVDKAHQSFTSDTPWSADKTKVGDVLLNKYAESGDMSKFKEIASSYDDQARQAGQGNAAINGWSTMSPKAVLNVVDDAANKLGKPISDDFRTQLVNRAADIQKMAKNSPERLQATQALLQDIAKELPNNFMENFKAYRFQNMLSNPVTIGKIGYSGLFNTMVTHPVDMIAEATTQGAKRLMNSDYQRTVYYSNIPKWYKDVFIGIPDAWDAAVQGFKKGTIDKALSDGVSGETAVQMARNQNTSKYLSFFPKLHSFVYNYGQSIISGAEFARMMDNGATEVEAKAAASKLADKLTLRSKLGANDQAAIVRAVDSMGNMISRSADKPGIGWMQSWVAPFMKVSTNWTKLAVEHSPLALPDTAFNMLKGKEGAENAFAHAMVGSIVTGVGVSMSMKDNVTLAAPTDKTQSDLFYASGKKPYSVKIGNSWVPMQYFGPFGLSLMLPQAMKEALTGVNAPKDTFTKSEQAVSKVTKMIISTTPLPTISQFIDILNGTSGVNPATVAAGLAGQVMPLDAMQRYISGIVDPIYRKASSFTDRIESGIPGMSKNLPAYTTPTGQPETRNTSNYIAPYGIGQQDNQYEPAYKDRQQVLNSNAIVNQANKDAQGGSIQNPNGGKQVADKIWQLPDNTFTYQLSDGSYAKAKTQDEAKLGQAKDTLLNTDDQQYAASGNKVLVKNDDGTVKTITSKVPVDPNDKTSLALIGSGHGALTQDYPTDDTPQSNQLKRQQVSQLQSLYLDDKVSDDDKNAAYQKLGLNSQDVDKMMQMKDDGVAISPTMVEAYKFDQQASQLPKDQANQMVSQLFTQDPKAYQMVKKIREYNTTGISTSDITTYNITNGERAKYIDSILSKRDPQEANTILGMLYKQGIVTKTVLKQLRQIRNAK